MTTERSDTLYDAWLSGTQKFDYFVAGVALALVGYLGATFRLSTTFTTLQVLEAAALVMLLGAAYAGLKRIEKTIAVVGSNYRSLRDLEGAGALTSAAMRGGAVHNQSTGEILGPDEIMQRLYAHKVGADAARETTKELADSSGFWYRVRNKLLIGGLIVLVAARLAEPLL